jgi:hypothetical protein
MFGRVEASPCQKSGASFRDGAISEINLRMLQDLSRDEDIRQALHQKRLAALRHHPNTIVVDELGLAHAKSRVDIAVINGCIHGYEIKSGLDTLVRFEGQFEVYRQTLQKLTFVLSPRHVDSVQKKAPDWCGLIEASQGSRKGVHFRVLRRPSKNPDVDPVMMAHLLWRSEAVRLLLELGHAEKDLRGPRIELYRLISAKMKAADIIVSIREAMIKRQVWRDHPLQG